MSWLMSIVGSLDLCLVIILKLTGLDHLTATAISSVLRAEECGKARRVLGRARGIVRNTCVTCLQLQEAHSGMSSLLP